MKQERNWHGYTPEELAAALRTDSVTGLSEREARRRQRRGRGQIWVVQGVSVKQYARRSLTDLSTVLLLITAFLAAVFGDATETAAVCILLVAARLVRIAAYVAAGRVFEKNAAGGLPQARVVRGGTVHTIPAAQVVPGDVIVLDAGDTVPCDVRLTAADGVLVAEEALTGEKGIVSKTAVNLPRHEDTPLPLRVNMVYASSAVVGGFCMGVAVATGEDTLVCAREGQIVLSAGENLPMLERLTDTGRLCSLGLIFIALVVTVIGTVLGGQDLFAAFLPSVALAAACMNEYLSAVGALSLAAALRPQRRGADGADASEVTAKTESLRNGIHDVAAAERAAETRILVLRSSDVFKNGKITPHAVYADGNYRMVSDPRALPKRLLYLAHCATGIPPGGALTGSRSAEGSREGVVPYSILRTLWEEQSDKKVADAARYLVAEHLPAGAQTAGGMDSALLYLDNRFWFTCMATPEELLPLCTTERNGDETRPLSREEKEKILSLAATLTDQGVKVVAVGFRPSHYNSLRRIPVLQSELCFEGFLALSERPKPETVAALSAFRKEGGRVVLFSDGTKVDRCFVQAEGIFKKGDVYITRKECAGIQTLPLAAGSLTMVCIPGGMQGIRERVRYVQMAKATGEGTAYFGWGVEDMWAMQQADVAFAAPAPESYGGEISQANRTAAHALLQTAKGGFVGLWRTLMRCRTAVWNIHRLMGYLIVSHMTRVVLLLICAAGGLPLLSAAQLVAWGVGVDFCVAIAAALIPAGTYVPPPPAEDTPGETIPREETVAQPRLARTWQTLSRGDVVQTLLFALWGTLLAILAILSPNIGRMLLEPFGPSWELSVAARQSCMFLTCVVAMPIIAAELCGGAGLFSRKSVYGKGFLLPAAAVIGCIVATFARGGFSPAQTAALDNAAPGWLLLIFALLPVLIALAAISLIRALLWKRK